jgi:hypothetical protein
VKSVRSYLSILLSFSLAASPVAMAGPKEDAREVVASSQRAARDKARMVFHEYLQQAALQTANVLSLADNFNQMSDNLGTQINDLEKLRLQLAQAMEKAEVPQDPDNVDRVLSHMSAIYTTTSDLYVAARAAEKQRDYKILKNGSIAEEIRNSLDTFLVNLQTTCQNGIPANFEYPDLPAVRPIVPSYSFGVNVGVDSGGYTSVQPQVPNVQTKGLKGDTANAVYTTAYAGGFVLGAYLVTGHLVLTGTAAAALTASQALAATGIGAAVAAVIALVVYFDALFDAIKDSRDVSDAMWIVFNEKADAETVRSEFKKLCQPFAERVANVRERIKAVSLNDKQAIADFDAESKEVQTSQEELSKLQQAYDSKSLEIKAALDADPNFAKADDASKQKEMMNRLAGADELKALKNYINNSQSDFMMKMFEVSLMNIGLHSEKVDAAMQVQYGSLFKKQADEHLAKIVSIAILGRRMAVPKEVRDLIQTELQANTRIAYLFRQFDASFANYVHMELTLGQDNGYKDELAQWLKNVKTAQKEFPASPTLKTLVARGESFLQYLGVK